MDEEKYNIYWIMTENLGEEFDDDERFCGHKAIDTLQIEENISLEKMKETLCSIGEIAADYGDGITNSRIVCICNSKTKEVIDRRYFEDD